MAKGGKPSPKPPRLEKKEKAEAGEVVYDDVIVQFEVRRVEAERWRITLNGESQVVDAREYGWRGNDIFRALRQKVEDSVYRHNLAGLIGRLF